MPTPSPSSAATPPGSAPRDPTTAAEPPIRTRRQVTLDVERLRELRGRRIGLDILAATRHKLSPGALQRAFRGLPVTITIGTHIARALGCELADIVEREVEDET